MTERQVKERRSPGRWREIEEAFMMSLEGISVRVIAERLGVTFGTASKWVRIEEQRRQAENESRRATETARSVATYLEVIHLAKLTYKQNALLRSNGGKVTSDGELRAIVDARNCIDRLYGLGPTRTDSVIEQLLAVLEPGVGGAPGELSAGQTEVTLTASVTRSPVREHVDAWPKATATYEAIEPGEADPAAQAAAPSGAVGDAPSSSNSSNSSTKRRRLGTSSQRAKPPST